ncbi:MAG: AAA family ATPase [Clostridia bacterium]|nr:AAA family ATPase [Clostridia bacterium]
MRISCELENIAFVGGPCSGKTSVFEALRAREGQLLPGVCISFIEEAATKLLPRDPTLSRRDPVWFQYQVSLWQYMEEDRGMERLFRSDAPLKIQISDRGVADAYIYLNEQQVGQMTDQSPDEMMHRYTAVLYFEPFHSQCLTDGNEFRVEQADEMAALEAKTRAIWQRHPNIVFVPTFATIEERIAYTEALLAQLIGREIFTDTKALLLSE